MVVKMKQIMRWPPWPPLFAVKFDVIVVVHKMEGLLDSDGDGDDNDQSLRGGTTRKRPVVEIKWKGPKSVTLKRSVVRNLTEEGGFRGDGVVEWNEEFERVCEFSVYKEGSFLPWLVSFTVFNGLNQGSKEKVRSYGKASLNIAEYFSLMKEDDVQVKVPLKNCGSSSSSASVRSPCLHISLQFSPKESLPERQRSALPVLWSPLSAEAEKPESVVKVGLRKMKTFNHCMSNPQASEKEDEKDGSSGSGSEGKSPERNLDSDSTYPFDTDSLDEGDAADESEENKENESSVADPVNYKTLRYANWARGSFHADTNPEDEDLIYYSNRSPLAETGDCGDEVSNDVVSLEQAKGQMSKKRMLSWKKRKLSFRSPKQKGEPLIKKDCLEEGGDDIDFDRRQLSSSDESNFDWYRSDDSVMKPLSQFGDDDFVVGSWETKEIISRDGLMKLTARVFLASIDQRSERAAGESACTALVAVMSHWLGSNIDIIPTRSEFDSLIREGSSEWRNMCENEEYRERFPDKHFDLETVLQAKIRPICVVLGKSFVRFFHPETSEEEEGKEDASLEFLKGVMSFDNIWEEIMKQEPEESASEPVIYIVSWNDHFFVLLVHHDAYYIIDTLGERLYEGCNQAYVLKFDKEAIKARAMRVLKQKKMYEGQRDMLYNQTFNLDQVSFAAEGLKDAQQTMTALKSTNKELKGMMKTVKIQDIDNLQDDMMDLMDESSEIQETLGRSYNVPDDIDEDDLMGELDALEADMGNETEADGVPSYLQPDKEPNLDDELNLPPAPMGHTGAPPGRAQAEDEWGLPAVPHASLRS